jgi:hypothetical protein
MPLKVVEKLVAPVELVAPTPPVIGNAVVPVVPSGLLPVPCKTAVAADEKPLPATVMELQ